jgi:hypothetical protein
MDFLLYARLILALRAGHVMKMKNKKSFVGATGS